jgi:type III restriction enzyme
MSMKLQFAHQDYQSKAVDAVVKVFDGQPLAKAEFALAGLATSVAYANDGSIGNALTLSEEQLLLNVQAVQKTNGLPLSSQLVASVSDAWGAAQEVFCPLNFSIEMETGTGKTYTFIKTMYELNKVYGFKKFVVVVPSVAIREGTMKNLEITRSHFAADYAHVPCVPILYDSGKLTDLRHFAQSDALSVLVINIDSFTKDSNKIKQKGERAFAPIEYIRAVNPIVIVDEPQNFETDVRRRALMDLNPLCTLRYSATHKNPYNLLYSLSPVQAYDLGLVKQIEVDGVLADADQNQAFVELLSIDAKARGITVKLRMDVNDKQSPKRKELTLKLGDDLYAKSGQRDVYQDGYILNEIRADEGEIEFSGGRVLRVNEAQGGLTEDVMRFQVERTVAAHFAKLKNMQAIGVKVLSLFFIDKVANYRAYDEEGNPLLGKFGVWFEEAFNKYASKPQYRGLIPHAAREVHDGYFSGDKKGKGAKAKTVWIDTSGTVAKDDSTYQLIMQDKERLLSTLEPLQFIFSHSALREGWDNPNVFQICTLNETQSAMKKRQEIGRGLRLCVNQSGERVMDKRVNVLTVIPNESYEAFAKALQQEIEDETGVSFAGRVKNARAKARIQRKPLSAEEEALFQAIWKKINYQTRYSVRLDTPQLVKVCIEALADTQQYPKVRPPKYAPTKPNLSCGLMALRACTLARAISRRCCTEPAFPMFTLTSRTGCICRALRSSPFWMAAVA